MFAQLLASRPVHQRSASGLSASVAVHGLLAAGAVWATVGPRLTVAPPPAHLVYVARQPVAPRPVAPPPAVPTVPAVGAIAVNVPIEVPDHLPIIDPARSLGELPPATRFVMGDGIPAPGAPAAPGTAYLAEQVEVPAEIERGSPLPRFPTGLRSAGIEGTARFQFVVDTLGRVELSTVRELQSTHQAFALAVRSTLPRMRFTPARVDGRPVRQLVEFPIVFRIER
jgi:TonB family protein